MTTPTPDVTVVRHEIAPRTVAWIAAAAMGLWLIYKLWTVVLVLVVALVFAGTFNPVMKLMETRGLKRGHALILLIGLLSLGAALLIFPTVPALIDQLTMIGDDLPGQRERMIVLLGEH